MVRGFVREVLSIASWIAAAAAAFYLYKPLIPLVRPYIESATVSSVVAAAAVFFVALIIASYITTKISDFVIDSRIGAIDRGLGFMFGAARGLLLVVIALLFFNWLVPTPPAWVANAQAKPMLDGLGERLMAALPEDIETSIMDKIRGGGSTTAVAPATTPDAATAAPEETPPAEDPAYGTTTRQNLEQLIQNSDN